MSLLDWFTECPHPLSSLVATIDYSDEISGASGASGSSSVSGFAVAFTRRRLKDFYTDGFFTDCDPNDLSGQLSAAHRPYDYLSPGEFFLVSGARHPTDFILIAKPPDPVVAGTVSRSDFLGSTGTANIYLSLAFSLQSRYFAKDWPNPAFPLLDPMSNPYPKLQVISQGQVDQLQFDAHLDDFTLTPPTGGLSEPVFTGFFFDEYQHSGGQLTFAPPIGPGGQLAPAGSGGLIYPGNSFSWVASSLTPFDNPWDADFGGPYRWELSWARSLGGPPNAGHGAFSFQLAASS